ncbi:MAG: PQQ-binding-like beta-propeller repeat protein [Planctomyces sp.]
MPHLRPPAPRPTTNRVTPAALCRCAGLLLSAGLALATLDTLTARQALAQIGGLPPALNAAGVPPVFVNDSPSAAYALAQADAFARSGNIQQAIVLLQRLLDNEPDALTPSPDDADLFLPVRQRVHALLIANPVLLNEYRASMGPLAQDQLDQGNVVRVERSLMLTGAGLEATLRLAQQRTESGAFFAAMDLLEQAATHPDLSTDSEPARRARAWAADLLAIIARFDASSTTTGVAPRGNASGDSSARASAIARRLALPGQAPATPAPAAAPTTAPTSALVPPANARPGRVPFSTLPAPDLDAFAGVVDRPLWSQPFAPEVPVTAASGWSGGRPGFADSAPEFARELRTFPCLLDDMVLLPSGLGVLALDRFTLRERWRFDAVAAGLFPDSVRGTPLDQLARGSTSLGIENNLSVAASAGLVIAIVQLPSSGLEEGAETLVALDARTGDLRWSLPISDLGEPLARGRTRGPVLIDGSTIILSIRKLQSERRLNASYLAAFDLHSGRPLWNTLVGSAGILPFLRTTVVSDGAIVDQGTIYRSDRLGLMAAYAAIDGRPHWVRRLTPEAADGSRGSGAAWQMNFPIAAGNDLFLLAPDRARVLRIARDSGRIVASMPTDVLATPGYLLRAGDRLIAVGATEVASVPIDTFGPEAKPVLSSGFMPQIRGRVLALQGDGPGPSMLAVPTDAGLSIVDAADPSNVLASLPLEAVGNPMFDAGQLLVVDDARAHAYFAWESVDRILSQRIEQEPADPTSAVTLADLAARQSRFDRLHRAIEQARAAILAPQDAASADDRLRAERAETQRARLVALLTSFVHDRIARPAGEPPRAIIPSEHATRMLESARELARTAPEQALCAIMLAEDRQRAGRSAEAAELLQSILLDDRLSTCTLPAPLPGGRADAEATARLVALLRTAGRGVYDAFDQAAQNERAALGPTPDARSLERLGARFPVSRLAPSLYLAAAEAHRQNSRSRAEARALEAGLRAGARLPDAPPADIAELNGRLIANLRARGLIAAAAGVARRAGSTGLTLDGRNLDSPALLADLNAGPARAWPAISAPSITAAPQILAGWIFQEPLILPIEPGDIGYVVARRGPTRAGEPPRWAILAPRSAAQAPAPDAAADQAANPDSRGALAPLVERWSEPDPQDQWRLLRTTPTRVLMARAGDNGISLRAIDPIAGTVLYDTDPLNKILPAADAAGVRTALDGIRRADEVHVCTDPLTVALVERSGRAAAFDAATGEQLWAMPDAGYRVSDAVLLGDLLVLAGERPGQDQPDSLAPDARLWLLDSRTGQVRRQIDLADGPVRWLRMTERADLLVATRSTIASIDPDSGAPEWSLQDQPGTASVEAFVAGDILITLGEDRQLHAFSIATGAPLPGPLDVRRRLDNVGTIDVLGVDDALAVRTTLGIALLSATGTLLGADAVGGPTGEPMLPPVPHRGGFVSVSLVGEATRRDDQLASFRLLGFDNASAASVFDVPIALPGVPQRIMVMRDRILVSAGGSSFVYAAPPAAPPVPGSRPAPAVP